MKQGLISRRKKAKNPLKTEGFPKGVLAGNAVRPNRSGRAFIQTPVSVLAGNAVRPNRSTRTTADIARFVLAGNAVRPNRSGRRW